MCAITNTYFEKQFKPSLDFIVVFGDAWLVWLVAVSFPRPSPSQHLLSNCLVLIWRPYNMVFWQVGFCHTESLFWLGNRQLLGHIPNRLKAVRMFLLKPWIPKDCYPWAPLYLYQLEVQSCNTSLSNALRHHSCHFHADFPQVLLLLATQAVSETL